jgi:hypothetical protein
LQSFLSGAAETLSLPGLSGLERRRVHQWAELQGLDHVSSGGPRDRVLEIRRRPGPPPSQHVVEERVAALGYVGLFSEWIEAWAARLLREAGARIHPEWLAARRARDGPQHHITLLTRDELNTLLSPDQARVAAEAAARAATEFDAPLPEAAAASAAPDASPAEAPATAGIWRLADVLECLARAGAEEPAWRVLGLGRVQDEAGQCAWFGVVEWEAMQRARECLGLPRKDFHFTLAFSAYDIHHLPKDTTSLVQPAPSPSI